jgi:hypothetical protein
MGFVSQLIASTVGGAVGGLFVLWGVRAQSLRQRKAALRLSGLRLRTMNPQQLR